MMVVAQDWLVLDLSGDSVTALATVTALQFTPMLLLTLYGGRVADRYDKRALLTWTNVVSGLLALPLGLLVAGDSARLWHVYAFAFALGVAGAVEMPTRLSFIAELVGPDLVPNASALSGAYFNVARVLGPPLAGLLIEAVGPGTVMLVNAASYAATVAGLRAMRPGELHHRPRRGTRRPGHRGPGPRAVPADLVMTLALLAAVSLFGLNLPLALPLMARTVFRTDATAFGLLTAALAAGSLLAAFTGTLRRGRPQPAWSSPGPAASASWRRPPDGRRTCRSRWSCSSRRDSPPCPSCRPPTTASNWAAIPPSAAGSWPSTP